MEWSHQLRNYSQQQGCYAHCGSCCWVKQTRTGCAAGEGHAGFLFMLLPFPSNGLLLPPLVAMPLSPQDAIVQYVMPFVTENIGKNSTPEDWRLREAATFAFGSILEGPSPRSLAEIVRQAMGFLLAVRGWLPACLLGGTWQLASRAGLKRGADLRIVLRVCIGSWSAFGLKMQAPQQAISWQRLRTPYLCPAEHSARSASHASARACVLVLASSAVSLLLMCRP
jgi:hypothetical protein